MKSLEQTDIFINLLHEKYYFERDEYDCFFDSNTSVNFTIALCYQWPIHRR